MQLSINPDLATLTAREQLWTHQQEHRLDTRTESLLIDPDGTLTLSLEGESIVTSLRPLQSGVWQTVTVTRRGSGYVLLIAGQVAGKGITERQPFDSADFFIGSNSRRPFWFGVSSLQISTPGKLAVYWPLDEGSGAIAHDLAGDTGARDGEIHNTFEWRGAEARSSALA